MAVFLAGTLVGNIYMPQKKLETSAIVSLKEPETSVDIKTSPDTAAAMKDLEELNSFLPKENKEDEAVLTLNTNIEKTLLLQSYLAAKYKYEIELLRVSATPEQKDEFIKARNNYDAIITLIQQAYPQIQENEVEVISPDQPAAEPVEAEVPTVAAATPVPASAQPSTPTQAATIIPAQTAPVITEKPANNIAGDVPASK